MVKLPSWILAFTAMAACATATASQGDSPPGACEAVLKIANAGTLRKALTPIPEHHDALMDVDQELHPDAEPAGVFRDGSEDYIVWIRGEDRLELLTTLDDSPDVTIVCEFGQREIEKQRLIQSLPVNYLLTRYEVFIRDAHSLGKPPWYLAMERPGLDGSKLLLANGHSPNEVLARDSSLLVIALRIERYDIFDLLLANGANPDLAPNEWDSPFEEALRHDQAKSALALLRAGASAKVDPSELLGVLAKSPAEGRTLLFEYLDKYGRITEWLLEIMVLNDGSLLPELARSERPVELINSEWRAGRLSAVPKNLREKLSNQPTQLAALEKLYARGTRAAATDVWAHYESRGTSWRFNKKAGNAMQDDEFLLLATSFCVHFLRSADCGPPELLRKSAAWLAASSLPCSHQRSRKELDRLACQVSMHYMKIQSGDINRYSVIVGWDAKGQGGQPLNLDQLCDLYASSHASRR